ncbi:coiled-coil domain-containing protein 88B isoform X2 [Tursiops truncatus]|uniref:coiled-coil domain-containing protein 88B isoform X2 n=1 Tax=Tursiops truncatus TaxID=9739 RepID=UPI003CCF8FAF
MIRGHDGPAAWRVWNLNHLWGRLRDFYQEELQLLILSPPPDLQALGFDPFSEEAVEELEGILRLLLGASVQCEHRELFIRHIQGLSLEVQSELAAAIQEVTQPGAGLVLALAGPEPGELAPPELEMLSRSLVGTLLRLARERDVGAQRLAELLLERQLAAPSLPEAPARTPPEGASHHLALQLANTKAQLRRVRQELEEKAELLLDSQVEVQGLEAEIRRLRQEAQALSGQAKRAELYREEAEALRERAGRLPRLQEELRRCRERLQAAEACKGQLEEERALSGALEASKALLEEQLDASQERCARLHETQRENLLLRTRLGEAHAELSSLRHQVDQLAEENVELELELQRSLEPAPGSPGEAPLPGVAPSLHEEVREAEAGRLRTLERENRELRGLLRALQGQPGGQHPLLEEPSEDSVIPEPDSAPQTRLASDHGPQGLAGQAGDEGPQALDPAPLASDSALEGLAECPQASDLDPKVVERPLQAAVTVPVGTMAQKSGPAVGAQESLQKAGLGAPLQTPAAVAPPQGPDIKIEAQLSPGGETGESVPEALGLRQEDPESKPGLSEPSLCGQLEETLDQRLDLPKGRAEAREHEQKLERMVGDPAQQKPQQKLEGAPEAQTWEGRIPGEILSGGVPEQEALKEEMARLRREAEALRAELEAQAWRLEARGTEAARLSEELAQARRAEAEAHREVEAQARELARLREAVEAAGRELEAASRERGALAEVLAATGRERRQWEREAPRLRARAEAAEEQLQVLQSESRRHLEEAERERRERQALQEELEKATARGQELGARLEHLQRELERATLEHQEFLREQEVQHQRYRGLEQRLEAELQVAATSKEEALLALKTRALQLEEELFQLRQGAVGQGPEKQAEQRVTEAQSARLIEVERSNATLAAEKAALQGQLQHLEGQLGSLRGRAQELLLQSQRAQEQSSCLQAEKSVLELQGQELHRKLGVLEEEVRAARRSQEETRGQQQALLRDHEALAQLQRRQEAELEGLLARHRDLKANMRALELAHRELQGRHEQLQAQRAHVEAQEVALLAERERLVQDGHRQRGLEEELRRLQSEHDRAQMLLAEVSQERGELQGERGELRGRLARLELERAQLEAQSLRLRESNQQLDLSACRLATQSVDGAPERPGRGEPAAAGRGAGSEPGEPGAPGAQPGEPGPPAPRAARVPGPAQCPAPGEAEAGGEDHGPVPRAGTWAPAPDQGPPHRHPCAGPRAPCACGMRPSQVGSGGNSAQDFPWGEALSHSAPGTPRGRDSDSGAQARWGHPAPMAKDLAWDGMALSRPWRSAKQMPTERTSRCRNRRNGLSRLPSASDTAWMGSLGVESSRLWSLTGGARQPKNLGRQGTCGKSLDREAWAPRSSTACTGAPSWSWDDFMDRADGRPPQTAPAWGSAMRPLLRRWSPGQPPAEGGRQEWAREPPARSRR